MTNKFILGTVQFGLNYGINNNEGKPSKEKIKEILDYAFLNNVSLLDTAEAYGDSQSRIGEYIKDSGNKFEVVTKFSPSRKDLPKNLYERIVANLNTLNLNYLYGYLFHSFSDYEEYFPLFEEDISRLKKEGKILKFGVSVYNNEEINEVLKNDLIEIIQLPFNILDNSNLRGKSLELMKQKGIEVHTRSVFLQGLFFKNPETLTGNISELKPQLNSIGDFSKKYNETVGSICLNYVVNQNLIDYVLIGVDNVSQLKQNLNSLDINNQNKILDSINTLKVKNTDLLNPSKWKP